MSVKKNNYLVPMVIQKEGNNERVYDIYSRLLKDRIIFLGDEVNDTTANLIVAQLLFLQSEDENKDVNLWINSPGGVITSGYAIMDTMRILKCPVATFCIGQSCSMGAVLLSCGTKGKRHALKNSRVMIHQPSGGFEGKATDIGIQFKEIQNMKDNLNKILAENTGQSLSKIQADVERDFFMSAQEAKEYGIVDEVL